jgi:hypothetical protein
MPNLETIRNQITSEVEKRHPSKDTILTKVNEELDLLEITDGLDMKNNLETFYGIWQKNKNKVGNKNDVNSWTAFALGITKKKPDGEYMPQRRVFARAGFPDVDTDFDDETRDKVYEYIIKKYGRENVGNIGTHGMLKFKSSITRITKVLDAAGSWREGKEGKDKYITDNAAKVTEILSSFPKGGILKIKDEKGITRVIKTVEDAYKYNEDFKFYMDEYPEIMEHAKKIEGGFANFGCLAKDTPILTNKGWMRIDQLSTRFKIAYIDNLGEVKYTNQFKSFKTGNKKVYRLRLSNSSFIDVTDEHLIFTDKGCIKFEEIKKDIKKYKIYGLEKEEFKE